MIKSELVTRILERNPDLYHRHVEQAVKTVLHTIEQALARGDRVELRGFGVFTAKKRRPKEGRNPRTGVAVAVPEKWHPFFHPAREIHRSLNGHSPPPLTGRADNQDRER